MNVEIRRKWETDLSVCGEMWIDGQFECLTLEPSRLTPIHADHPCFAAGGPFRWTFTSNTSGNWNALIFGLRAYDERYGSICWGWQAKGVF
jgi:hypothetical protein